MHWKGSPEENLKKNSAGWFKYYNLSQKILHHQTKAHKNKQKTKAWIEKITGKKVKHIDFYKHDTEIDGSYWERLTIGFTESFPSMMKIETFYTEHNTPGGTYIQAYNNEEIIFFQAWLDDHHHLIRAKTWEYNQQNLLWRQKSFDQKGHLIKTVYANRRVMPLEEIYTSCKCNQIPVNEILKVARRSERTLVTILDSGVDYNHPQIAYKIPRPSRIDMYVLGPAMQKAKDLIARLTAEREALKKKSAISEHTEKISLLNKKIAEHITMLQDISIGWDFEEDDNQPYDYDNVEQGILGSVNHGTHVAGIVTQGSDDIAILPVRRPVKNAKKDYDAIEFAHQKGSRIVNISVTFDDKEEYKYLDKAIQNHPDMLFVVAAGNQPLDIDQTTSLAALNHPNMLVVASVDDNGKLSAFSGYGKTSVDVAAKGENIISLEPEAGLGAKTGASQATPVVTRIAAKISFINPWLNPVDIIDIIAISVDKNEHLKSKLKYGGIVNENRAVEMARKTLPQRKMISSLQK
ncbi:MAG: S8 family serine peptidase [Thermodesulfobacteriota bacterium]|nr:S8 family serine peptidase [Thermodesulfobacteriota bacterium]